MDKLMEDDAKFKAEQEARRIEHEEEMFMADLQLAMDKEKAMGRAKKLHLREMKEVEQTIEKLHKKMAFQDQIREQNIKLKKHEMREKNQIWEQKRVHMKNEALTIKHEDYQQLVPA